MVLTIDTGNTNVKFSFYENRTFLKTLRIETRRDFTTQDFLELIPPLFEEGGIAMEDIEGGIISSVVPQVSKALRPAIQELTGLHFLMLGDDVETGLKIDMDAPETIGHDLLADAVAGLEICEPPMVIFDTGTATTMQVLDKDGVYIGGLIIPGMRLSLNALYQGCAQLPKLSFVDPPVFIGKNTVDSMHAGVVYGHAAMIDNLIERVERELGMPVNALATGGLMPLILKHCERDIYYSGELLTDGLLLLYERNLDKIPAAGS